MNKEYKIFVTGHRGMVGSAIIRELKEKNYNNILTISRTELDLTRQDEVEKFFIKSKPDVVIDCAAKVGGIHANNTYRADFIYDNLQIQNNLIHSSQRFGVEKFLFLGSSCIYPKFADQPIKEEYLLASPLEYTNEPYSVAKIAGIKMCESYYKQFGCDFISVMPTNLYGPNDNFHLENSHVLPGLLRKFHEAYIYNYKKVKVWGTGKAKREFLHVDDLSKACIFILENVKAKDIYDQGISHLNIGSGEEISIADLATLIANTVKYDGRIEYDLNVSDGTLRKALDSSRLNKLGWKPGVALNDGLIDIYAWFKEQKELRNV